MSNGTEKTIGVVIAVGGFYTAYIFLKNMASSASEQHPKWTGGVIASSILFMAAGMAMIAMENKGVKAS